MESKSNYNAMHHIIVEYHYLNENIQKIKFSSRITLKLEQAKGNQQLQYFKIFFELHKV